MLPHGRVADVREQGAVGDGRARDTEAIQSAIDAMHQSGGGTVYVPPGDYRIGTLHLKSHVTLHLEANASLWGSTDQADYDPECLIYANGAQGITVTGRGAIDGEGDVWFERMGWRQKKGWRPRALVHLVDC